MATDVYYNGVWLHNVSTREFHQQCTYDASGTDQMSQHFQMRFEGIVHIQAPDNDGSGIPFDWNQGMWVAPESLIGSSQSSVGSPTDVYLQVRARLQQPRRPLAVYVNGQALFRCVPTGTGTDTDPDRDVKNGPKPISFDLNQVVSSSVFRVSFVVECEKLECGLCDTSQYGSADIPYILSNRWGISESMDSDYFTHRTIQGRMVLSASSWWNTAQDVPQGLPAHLFKLAVIPGLEDGFKRDSIDFSVDATGLACSYSILDRQVTVAAPFPLTRCDGDHTETIQNGVTYISEARVAVAGPPNIGKEVLITRAIQFLDAKLNLSSRIMGKDWMLQHAMITEHIGVENTVEAAIRILQTIKETEHLTSLRTDGFTGPPSYKQLWGEPLYNPRVSWIPDAYGYTPEAGPNDPGGVRSPAVLTLLHCYLQDPCQADHFPAGYQGTYEYTTSYGTQQTTTVKKADSPYSLSTTDQSSKYSSDHQNAIYTHAVVSSRYTVNKMRVQLPIASTTILASSDTCKVVQLGAAVGSGNTQGGLCRREIYYEADRVGDWPQIPAPMDTYTDGGSASGGLTATLLHWDWSPLPPELTLDKRMSIYRIKATYVYALNRPPTPLEAVKIGWLPFNADPQSGADTLALQTVTQNPVLNPGSATSPSQPPSSP